MKNKIETEVIIGHYGNLSRKDKDYESAKVMNFILGGGGSMLSRIGKKIRESLGLVYNINSDFNALLVSGSWSIKFGVDSNYIDLSISTLKNELNNFVENGITQEELETAKSYLAGSYPLKFSNNKGIAKALLINELYDLGDNYIYDFPIIINSITKEAVEECAAKYIHPDKLSVVVAGNF